MFWKKKEWSPEYRANKVDYPSGTVVKTLTGNYWYIKGKNKFLIPTDRVLQSWKFGSYALTAQDNLDGYKNAGKLGFREGTLFYNHADGKVYLVSANKKRHITDPDAYAKYGLNEENIIEVSDDEANLHDDGEVLK